MQCAEAILCALKRQDGAAPSLPAETPEALDCQPYLCCVERSGETVAGDPRFPRQRSDIFSVPCDEVKRAAATDVHLFSILDEPLRRFFRFPAFPL